MQRLFPLLALVAIPAAGQTFEVATIRAAVSSQASEGGGIRVNGNQVAFGSRSLSDLVIAAYEVDSSRLKAPAWMSDARFDISALMPDGASRAQIPSMLRALLKDRFRLVVHTEGREQEVFALEVAGAAHKMKEAAPLDPARSAQPPPPPPPRPGTQNASSNGPVKRDDGSVVINSQTTSMGIIRSVIRPGGGIHWDFERITMAQLTERLAVYTDLPVVDRSGLNGAFLVSLDMSAADNQAAARKAAVARGAPPPPDSPTVAQDLGGDLRSSLDNLGLRLRKIKLLVESVTVESAERTPTEN